MATYRQPKYDCLWYFVLGRWNTDEGRKCNGVEVVWHISQIPYTHWHLRYSGWTSQSHTLVHTPAFAEDYATIYLASMILLVVGLMATAVYDRHTRKQ